MTKGVILTDIESSTITPEDKEVIEHPAIFGILLFAKNYENPEQLRALTRQLHEIKPNLVISVDQEGGRVQRFREGFSDLKSMSEWGKLYNTQPEVALKGLQEQTKTMVTELQRYGVQVSL
ncbi:MAG: beta-N-acetylhexosaminidase, partial [Coxiellaceae bacterium]|nr:beta-N-acetylhexosaminidase [Coxiellaceae bacterium]